MMNIVINKKKLSKIVRLIIVIVIVLVILSPIFWMVKISFTPKTEVFKMPPKIFSGNFSIQGYINVFKSSYFFRYYLNSLIVASGTIVVCLFCGILAGYSFSRFKFGGKKILMVFILFAQMFPAALLIISLYKLFLDLKLYNTYFAIILAHSTFALPLTTWIIKSYFDSVPKELEEAAYIDGCSRMRTLTTIIVPISFPGIVAAGIYIFIYSWNDFIFGLTLVNSDSLRILTPGITLTFIGQFEYLWVEMMSASVIISLPIILLFLFLQRYFIKGLTAGAVKE